MHLNHLNVCTTYKMHTNAKQSIWNSLVISTDQANWKSNQFLLLLLLLFTPPVSLPTHQSPKRITAPPKTETIAENF